MLRVDIFPHSRTVSGNARLHSGRVVRSSSDMPEVSVTPVYSKRDQKQFIKFQWQIYRGNPYWVPPLLMDRRKLIDREKNPFYKHAEADFFLARRDGEIVGRIAAIVNHNHNNEHKESIGFFGFFECINDQHVADALFSTAKAWLKDRGVTAIRGPASPSVNEEYGLLIEGFDKRPAVLMPYNPPYYAALIERAGLQKIKDLYSYEVKEETAFSERLVRVSEMVKKREGLTFRTLNIKEFDKEVERIRDLYNRAWQYNWGAVPMTDEEIEALARDLRPIVIPELVIFAESRGEPIGFSLSLPDLNEVLIRNKRGYLIPGLVRLLLYKKTISKVRIVVLGVLREHQMTGAAAVLFYETGKRGVELGYHRGEAGWVLEDNHSMVRAAQMMNGERQKTYRIYQGPL